SVGFRKGGGSNPSPFVAGKRSGAIAVRIVDARCGSCGGARALHRCPCGVAVAVPIVCTGRRMIAPTNDAGSIMSRKSALCAASSSRRRSRLRRLAAIPVASGCSASSTTGVEVRLIDELHTDDRRSGSVGELVGQLIGDFADLLVDLERELARSLLARGDRRASDIGTSPSTAAQ